MLTTTPGEMTSARTRHAVNYDERPMLVFWETTKACLLACRHCRAEAAERSLPGELTTAEGLALIDQIAGFGRPYPILVLTGGDCLLRPDLFELADYAIGRGIPTCLSPSVTPQLTSAAIHKIAASGVTAVSISLDGARAETHEGVRGVPGHFAATVQAIQALADAGLTVQVNTTVMPTNAAELADIAKLTIMSGARVWEVFFLVQVGRGVAEDILTADEHEEICHFLFDAAHYGITVRTVEAPFFRRIVTGRRFGDPAPTGVLYQALVERLRDLLGAPGERPSAHTAPTRDGKGILFVAHDGEIYPAGFLPLALGNVRSHALSTIYRRDPLLCSIRAARFAGRCGECEYADLCGGSRARAYAGSGDPLGEDPACAYQPVGHRTTAALTGFDSAAAEG